ncbi:hypothetical protein NW762_011590 [Fusarium torreyae]|uniref:FAD-binding PCMH-type domain-containing protein n=1 Tax=Fusarium torreyae TaxID=1237075 RepID=A0A9W8RRG8_9HYPO|nr:hypothetical protein NW762_011590 [Fusarium torreyae]
MSSSTIHQLHSILHNQGIPFAVQGSADFESIQESYTGKHTEKQPGVITKPQSPEHVASIVRTCLNLNLEPVVRGGGHDMFGRFSAHGAVSIDLRDLNTVTVSTDKSRAKVGGGTTNYQVLEALSEHSLTAPTGSCGTVGFAGWCLGGGFGTYMHSYGLGADQIVGARVVNASGELVNADARLLKGLRGGGGSLAIVVELEIKTWPLCDVQAGRFLYESSDIKATVSKFFTAYNDLLNKYKLPSELYLLPSVWLYPDVGLALTCGFVWNGPSSKTSRLWVERAATLAPLASNIPDVHSTIINTSALGFAAMVKDMVPDKVLGRCQTADVSILSSEVVTELADISSEIPRNSSGGFIVHTLRADSPSCGPNAPDSVLPYRKPHIMFEILGLGDNEVSAAEAALWSLNARNRLAVLPHANAQTYLPLTAPEFVNLAAIFGDNLAELKKLKQEYDPNGVFKHTLPKLA